MSNVYCGVDVTMVANEVNKFGQIFPIHRRRKYKDIQLSPKKKTSP
jgi:hypothetical protein